MKIIFYVFFFFLIACGGKKEELVDLKSFTNQGEKIVLVQKKNLNFTNIKIISNSGHWIHAENPSDFLRSVDNFLSSRV